MEDWLPHYRGFQKECPVCQGVFIGRKNRKYCSSACKARYNNDIAKERRDTESDIVGSILRNARILQQILEENGNLQTVSMDMSELTQRGFDPKAPTKRFTKDDKVWYGLGALAFHVQNDNQVYITDTRA